jgi:hypothetical protein
MAAALVDVEFYFRIQVPILNGFDKHGRRVMIARSSVVDPSKFSMTDQFKAGLMVNELMMRTCDDFQGHICGVVIIQDVAGVSIGHVKNFNPSVGKKAMTIFQANFFSNFFFKNYYNNLLFNIFPPIK